MWLAVGFQVVAADGSAGAVYQGDWGVVWGEVGEF
mgnify:CR=1 FL=1